MYVRFKRKRAQLLTVTNFEVNLQLYALARVYSCLQIGDLQLVVSCGALYDNNFLFCKQTRQSLQYFKRKPTDGISCVTVPIA